ncbi:hypothetical protein [Burkholderia gladioli]|uniref:hypothetical protein n=1 Tax=Burkholderia gladioli TaxID=28095 RepID=UPI00163F80F3|nr:hypothetical protein [Burkholderia gladioli]
MNHDANGTIAGLARSVDAGSGGAAHCDRVWPVASAGTVREVGFANGVGVRVSGLLRHADAGYPFFIRRF